MGRLKFIICLVVMIICLMIKWFSPESASEFTLQAVSDALTEDCFICGSHSDSLMSRYSQKDSIGIVYWNQSDINDMGVREFDDSGNELYAQGHIVMQSFHYGLGYGSISLTKDPDRGISRATVYYTNADTVDINNIKTILCQECLDKVIKFYDDQVKHGSAIRLGTTGFCLVDFQTRELYTLSDPYRGCSFRDYHVAFFIDNDFTENSIPTNGKMDILIFYAPKREPESK